MRILLAAVLFVLACAPSRPPVGYALVGSGANWSEAAGLPALEQRYPEFFGVILDPGASHEPDLRPVRRDLEHAPTDGRNYAALHAIAIAYFELNYRAEMNPRDGLYLGNSFRAAKLVAVPWRAYSIVDDPGLRDAILDFFEDIGSGDKPGTARSAARLASTVASLEAKETDPGRQQRIRQISQELAADQARPL
jgi:hypothetical protein